MSAPRQSANRQGPVVLVSAPIAFTFPLSYAYLAGYLVERQERVVVLFRQANPADTVRAIMDQRPLLVGFGSLYPELEEIRQLIGRLDQAGRSFPVVIGGQMVSPTPEFAVRVTRADYGIVGEGEITLHRLVVALREGSDPAAIPGLAIRAADQVLNTGIGAYIEDLASLPPIPYELFPLERWLMVGRWYTENCPQPHWRFRDRVINVHGGRGCPFSCNFCYHHSRARYRPVETMLAEAQEACQRFSANMLYFSDDLVLATPQRARQLIDGLRTFGRRLPYSVSARFDTLARLDDELLCGLKETGCRIMGLGAESGSDRVLRLVGKNCTGAMIRDGLRRLRNVGILPTTSIMVGQHTETCEDAEASVALVRDTVREDPNIQYAFTVTTPFPGSPLYRTLLEEGHLRDDQEFYDRYFSKDRGTAVWSQVVNLSAMTDAQVQHYYGRLWQVYAEEKARSLGPAVRAVERLQRGVGRAHLAAERRILSRLASRSVGQAIGWTERWVYGGCQTGLERINLKLRRVSL